VIPTEGGRLFRGKAAGFSRSEATLVFFVFSESDIQVNRFLVFRIDSPFSVMRWALWTSRSQMASATVALVVRTLKGSSGPSRLSKKLPQKAVVTILLLAGLVQ
jgi:hypothetical protein